MSLKKFIIFIFSFVVLVAVCLIAYLGMLKVKGNIHTVIPGQVYRSEQLSLKHLQDVIKAKHIKTILDLAPINDLNGEQKLSTKDHVEYIYFPMKALGKASVKQTKQLANILIMAKKPLLIHCKAGADRTGLASAMILILENKPLSDIEKQVEWFRYGIVNNQSIGRATLMPYFHWLQQKGYHNSMKRFFEWLG